MSNYEIKCHHRHFEGEKSCPKEDCMRHCDKQWSAKTLAQIEQLRTVHVTNEPNHEVRLYQDDIEIESSKI